MNQDYTDVITQISELLFNAIREREPSLLSKAHFLDGSIAQILRLIGWQVMSMLLAWLSQQVTEEQALAQGMQVHRRPLVKYFMLFGPVEVESPYLWNRSTSQGARPVKDQLHITNGGRTQALEKALVSLGAEQSYSQAARQFEEHYGWSIDRYRLRRTVVKIAPQAQEYVSQRLEQSRQEYSQPLDVRPGQEQILLELDGCHIRTATLSPLETLEVTEKRQLPKRKRKTEWREVRVGLARPLQHKEQKTFVASMSKYPLVVSQLVCAAVEQGMSRRSLVYGVGDGGNGLREELEKQFPGLQFILDQPHLKKHLYETAQEMGKEPKEKHSWVLAQMQLISSGKVQQLLQKFQSYRGRGQGRLSSLCNYLKRFSNCINYDSFVELGLPIGSGEIESAHRYIPQKRLKIPGASWHPDSINSMLALRIMRVNDWWQHFWEQKASTIPLPLL